MTLSEYFQRVNTYRDQHPEQRYGQACFNVLMLLDPDAVDVLWAGPADPYFVDFNTPGSEECWAKFITFLTEIFTE